VESNICICAIRFPKQRKQAKKKERKLKQKKASQKERTKVETKHITQSQHKFKQTKYMTHSQHMFDSAIHTFDFLGLVAFRGVAISVEFNICIGAIRFPKEKKQAKKIERKIIQSI